MDDEDDPTFQPVSIDSLQITSSAPFSNRPPRPPRSHKRLSRVSTISSSNPSHSLYSPYSPYSPYSHASLRSPSTTSVHILPPVLPSNASIRSAPSRIGRRHASALPFSSLPAFPPPARSSSMRWGIPQQLAPPPPLPSFQHHQLRHSSCHPSSSNHSSPVLALSSSPPRNRRRHLSACSPPSSSRTTPRQSRTLSHVHSTSNHNPPSSKSNRLSYNNANSNTNTMHVHSLVSPSFSSPHNHQHSKSSSNISSSQSLAVPRRPKRSEKRMSAACFAATSPLLYHHKSSSPSYIQNSSSPHQPLTSRRFSNSSSNRHSQQLMHRNNSFSVSSQNNHSSSDINNSNTITNHHISSSRPSSSAGPRSFVVGAVGSRPSSSASRQHLLSQRLSSSHQQHMSITNDNILLQHRTSVSSQDSNVDSDDDDEIWVDAKSDWGSDGDDNGYGDNIYNDNEDKEELQELASQSNRNDCPPELDLLEDHNTPTNNTDEITLVDHVYIDNDHLPKALSNRSSTFSSRSAPKQRLSVSPGEQVVHGDHDDPHDNEFLIIAEVSNETDPESSSLPYLDSPPIVQYHHHESHTSTYDPPRRSEIYQNRINNNDDGPSSSAAYIDRWNKDVTSSNYSSPLPPDPVELPHIHQPDIVQSRSSIDASNNAIINDSSVNSKWNRANSVASRNSSRSWYPFRNGHRPSKSKASQISSYSVAKDDANSNTTNSNQKIDNFYPVQMTGWNNSRIHVAALPNFDTAGSTHNPAATPTPPLSEQTHSNNDFGAGIGVYPSTSNTDLPLTTVDNSWDKIQANINQQLPPLPLEQLEENDDADAPPRRQRTRSRTFSKSFSGSFGKRKNMKFLKLGNLSRLTMNLSRTDLSSVDNREDLIEQQPQDHHESNAKMLNEHQRKNGVHPSVYPFLSGIKPQPRHPTVISADELALSIANGSFDYDRHDPMSPVANTPTLSQYNYSGSVESPRTKDSVINNGNSVGGRVKKYMTFSNNSKSSLHHQKNGTAGQILKKQMVLDESDSNDIDLDGPLPPLPIKDRWGGGSGSVASASDDTSSLQRRLSFSSSEKSKPFKADSSSKEDMNLIHLQNLLGQHKLNERAALAGIVAKASSSSTTNLLQHTPPSRAHLQHRRTNSTTTPSSLSIQSEPNIQPGLTLSSTVNSFNANKSSVKKSSASIVTSPPTVLPSKSRLSSSTSSTSARSKSISKSSGNGRLSIASRKSLSSVSNNNSNRPSPSSSSDPPKWMIRPSLENKNVVAPWLSA